MAIANRRDLSDHQQPRLALHLETLMSCDRQRRRFLKLRPLAEVGLTFVKLSSASSYLAYTLRDTVARASNNFASVTYQCDQNHSAL
jgi:hypothetical protein